MRYSVLQAILRMHFVQFVPPYKYCTSAEIAAIQSLWNVRRSEYLVCSVLLRNHLRRVYRLCTSTHEYIIYCIHVILCVQYITNCSQLQFWATTSFVLIIDSQHFVNMFHSYKEFLEVKLCRLSMLSRHNFTSLGEHWNRLLTIYFGKYYCIAM